MILGGFLMLPSTFDNDAFLRVSELFIGMFAAVVLALAFFATAFLALKIRNPFFRASNIYAPSLTSSTIGLLTILWDFIISRRYTWNAASKTTITIASISTLTYFLLWLWTQRTIRTLSKRNGSITQSELLRPSISNDARSGEQWGDQRFYQNYVKNMFPASLNPNPTGGIDQSALTDAELQRQQMLMLLQPTDQHGQMATPDASRSTFRIEWQGQDGQEEEEMPREGWYAPRRDDGMGQRLRPWDGVWRGQEPPRSHSAASSIQLTPK